jgi:hypothetical protein
MARTSRLPLRPSGHLSWDSFTGARPLVPLRKPSVEGAALRPMCFLAWSAEAEGLAAAADFMIRSLPNKWRQLRKNYR